MGTTDERLQEHGEHLARHDEQIKTLFATTEEIKALAESTHSLAVSVEKLTSRITHVEDDLEAYNEEKNKKSFAVWQVLMSAIVGGVATYILTNILR